MLGKKKLRIPLLLMVLWCITVALSVVIAIRVLSKEVKTKKTSWLQRQYIQREGWVTLNDISRVSDPKRKTYAAYDSFKIDFPLKYIYTSGINLFSYISEGGFVPFHYVFASRQVFDKKDFDNLLESNEPCVIMPTFEGKVLGEIDFSGFGGIQVNDPVILSEEQLNVRNITFIVRKISGSNRIFYEALANMPEGVTYLFQSCNAESGQDLVEMLKTFDTRGNYLERQ